MHQAFEFSFKQLALNSLKKSGARLTKARKAVIECFDENLEPMAVKDVIAAVNRLAEHKGGKSIEIDPVTIYRILERFQSLGLIHQISPSGQYVPCTHLRCQESHHVLLRCQNCGSVTEEHVPRELLASFFWYLSQNLKFDAKKHAFQLDGSCRDCMGN
jgi:Fur family zinc uptake transcriptional regulator